MEAEDERIGGYLGDSMGEQLPVTGDSTSPLVAPQISSIAASSDANAEIPVEADRSSASRPISRARFLWVSKKDERSFFEDLDRSAVGKLVGVCWQSRSSYISRLAPF